MFQRVYEKAVKLIWGQNILIENMKLPQMHKCVKVASMLSH